MAAINYCGHSCFMVSDNNHKVIIDPFLTGNGMASIMAEDVTVDAVLLTHGHGDHAADAEAIAKRNDALIVATYELATYYDKKGCKTHSMGIGGAYEFPFGKVKFTPAFHSSSVSEGDYAGMPAGILLTMENKVIYHAGDTGLFGDMKLLGELNNIDTALLPIGDNFTMGIDDALYALKLLNPRMVIPMHYNTFPVIEVDDQEFAEGAKSAGFACKILKPGETVTI